MQEQQWEVLEHPPYSPDLAPSDFHLFGPLKHHLSAEHFPNNEAVEREVTAWFRQQPKESYAAGFQVLGRVISPSQDLYLNTGQHEHRINAYTHQTYMP
jgi:hypothetical protein